jgi:hypothetical protein
LSSMRRSDPKNFENAWLLRQSKLAHERDVKNNQAPLGFKPNKPADTRSAKARAFEKRWLG